MKAKNDEAKRVWTLYRTDTGRPQLMGRDVSLQMVKLRARTLRATPDGNDLMMAFLIVDPDGKKYERTLHVKGVKRMRWARINDQ